MIKFNPYLVLITPLLIGVLIFTPITKAEEELVLLTEEQYNSLFVIKKPIHKRIFNGLKITFKSIF